MARARRAYQAAEGSGPAQSASAMPSSTRRKVGAAVSPFTIINSRPRQGTATEGRMRARQAARSAAERKPPIAFTSEAICAAISPS